MKDEKTFEPACFYLRKSREDQEAEQRGEGETLAKHRKALIKLAKDYKVNIGKTFEEVVSGESVIHRPQMLELLKEIEAGKWKAVFCMDVDRLGRGGMRDQGLILETFKSASTLIVTPRKIYDLNNEFDEEYTEFEAFMARKELKIITRRMQSGRRRSVEEGNFLGSVPPYGYVPKQDGRRRYLIKNLEQSECVDLIFMLYTEQFGASKVANHLNKLGFTSTTGIPWTRSSVFCVLKNPVYAGVITWGKKKTIKSTTTDKKESCISRPRSEQIWTYDAHEPYITMKKFEQIQEIIKGKSHVPYFIKLTNPLAGIIKCADCGKKMVYRPYTHGRSPHIMCYNALCQNKSSQYRHVEAALLKILGTWLDEYKSAIEMQQAKAEDKNVTVQQKALVKLKKEFADLEKQKDNLHDFLEKGIYDTATFLERSGKLATKNDELKQQITDIEKALLQDMQLKKAQRDIIPKIERVIRTYPLVDDPETKNKLLKSIISHAIYKKEKSQRNDDFSLTLYPRILEDNQYV